jgi:hypothetical protein
LIPLTAICGQPKPRMPSKRAATKATPGSPAQGEKNGRHGLSRAADTRLRATPSPWDIIPSPWDVVSGQSAHASPRRRAAWGRRPSRG